MSLWIKW